MLARLLLNPWGLALTASAVAALMAWAAWGQFQRANAAVAREKALQEAAEITSDYILRQREREADILAAIGDLANVPETNVCVDSPSLRSVGDRLRPLGSP